MKQIGVFIIFVFTIFYVPQTYGQSITVRGRILNLQTQNPLPAATVITPDSSAVTRSDKNGYFEIQTPTSTDTGQLKVSKVGYSTQEVDFTSEDRNLTIQLKPDNSTLDEVVLTSYNSFKKNWETPGAITTISGEHLKQGSGLSLQPGLNSIPGVKTDQSTLADSRISIRGNGNRSNWGTRNIKVYINDIPFTETDGTTRLEGIDVHNLGKAEVIRGPASSIYGGGTTGGVINFELQQADYQENSLEASGLVGSYGLKRSTLTYRNGTDKMNSYVSYGWQEMDGYRDHNSDLRHTLNGNFQFNPSEKQQITFLFSRNSQDKQMPGAINKNAVQENRRQANPNYQDKNAGRDQKWTRLGVSHRYRFNDKFTNTTSVFTHFFTFDQPLPFAYKLNDYQSYGGRTKFTYQPGFKKFDTKFTVGAEYNQSKTKENHYENNHGERGDVKANLDNKSRYYTVFYQSETNLTEKMLLTAGLSMNGLRYETENFLSPAESGEKRFKAQVSPRVALSYNFSESFSLHGGVSTGFAPPIKSEIQLEDGTINPNIDAEKALNYEINAKGNFGDHRLSYDLALFRMDMKNELIGQRVDQGSTVYHNSGRSKHEGLELALSYQAVPENENKAITRLQPYAALTYSHFRFTDYKELGENGAVENNFDGNDLTGIAPWVFNIGVDLETWAGFYFTGTYHYNDRVPLNDANTDYHPSYGILNGKIGFRKRILAHFDIDIFAGLNNLTDKKYSSFNEFNATPEENKAPAYFNPAPEINGYGGISVKYNFR